MIADPQKIQAAAARLHEIYIQVQAGAIKSDLEPSFEAEAQVLKQFQPIFSAAHLPELTEAEFHSFLLFKNNQHWSGLHRLSPRLCADMDTLRNGLQVLLDESQPIAERYDYALGRVHGMGRAVATAILLVAYPETYGVWNTTSEAGLKTLDLWPKFERGEPEGQRYLKINEIFHQLAQATGVRLWVLDALWWYLLDQQNPDDSLEFDPNESLSAATLPEEGVVQTHQFGLERHLQDFLWDNWEQTELAEWQRYTEAGNERAGYEYPCDVGRIDILARHSATGNWLVIELKREQTSDKTVGQVLRYMGWVKRHLAIENEEVEGLIVALSGDDRIQYAIDLLPNVSFKLYRVHFSLHDAPSL